MSIIYLVYSGYDSYDMDLEACFAHKKDAMEYAKESSKGQTSLQFQIREKVLFD